MLPVILCTGAYISIEIANYATYTNTCGSESCAKRSKTSRSACTNGNVKSRDHDHECYILNPMRHASLLMSKHVHSYYSYS